MNRKEKQFVETVWQHYETQGRHNLPWRKTRDPYRILVSEMMLQQTQVSRVLPKYQSFLQQFVDTEALATAPLRDVLVAWQGLGYNRRAKALQAAAQAVLRDHGGVWPRTYETLQTLPGVGPYTAGAVLAFAYNKAIPIIETNIRTVYLHHFFKTQTAVTDAELRVVVERTLDLKQPRTWYAALMDYGAHLKHTERNLNKRSQAYVRQSPFKGSDREVRGAIVRLLATEVSLTKAQLHTALSFRDHRIDAQLARLVAEGMVVAVRRRYQLPT